VRVRFKGNGRQTPLTEDAVYDVMQIEGGLYRILSDVLDDDALFPPDLFEVVEETPRPPEYAADDPRVAIY